MKIIELILLHAGYNDNRRAKFYGWPEPYPECKYPVDRVSLMRIQFDDRVITVKLLTPGDVYMDWKHNEDFEHITYLRLQDEIIAAIRTEMNKQAGELLDSNKSSF